MYTLMGAGVFLEARRLLVSDISRAFKFYFIRLTLVNKLLIFTELCDAR